MKYSIQVLFAVSLVLTFSCASPTSTNEHTKNTKPSLKLVWETDSLMTTCEAVKYDREREVIYVSNINKNPWGKDGDGFISQLDTEGNIKELAWITGLNGPKGIGIWKDKLYVADIDELVEIDIPNGKIITKYAVEGTPNLNDVTIGASGEVYVSGSASNTIYHLTNDTLQVFSKMKLGQLNGLLHHSESLYFICNEIHSLGTQNVNTNEFEYLVDSLGHGDGIVAVGNGDLMVSDWAGRVFYIHASGWKRETILDTREKEIQAADIDYIQDAELLIVPTFFSNRVRAYKLVFDQR